MRWLRLYLFWSGTAVLKRAALKISSVYIRVDDAVDLSRTVYARRVDLHPPLRCVFANIRGATDIGKIAYRLPHLHATSHLNDRTLGVAEEQQISTRIQKN